jgi:hypothetical protein
MVGVQSILARPRCGRLDGDRPQEFPFINARAPGAKARVISHELRGAEAPLFHGRASTHNFFRSV